MNALADDRVADFLNENFTSTYLKVGTFQIIGGAKVGGNVATYFCLPDGTVLHAIAGKVEAEVLLKEARWAHELRKSALTFATDLVSGKVNGVKARHHIRLAHTERYHSEVGAGRAPLPRHAAIDLLRTTPAYPLPAAMPLAGSNQSKVHWLLASPPLPKLDTVYPVVWQRILREKLSALPVAAR